MFCSYSETDRLPVSPCIGIARLSLGIPFSGTTAEMRPISMSAARMQLGRQQRHLLNTLVCFESLAFLASDNIC